MAGIEGILPVQQSFNGGEIGPLVAARIDQVRYQTGCKIMRNSFPLVQGPATRRPGTHFVGKAKMNDVFIKLVPFVFSEEQARVLEFGPGYIRFWTEDGYITGGERAVKDFTVSIKGSGGPVGQGWEYVTPGSHTFIAPVAGTYEMECVGAGSGSHASGYSLCSAEDLYAVGSSGAGGGYAKTTTFINSGVSVPIVVGAGGSGAHQNDYWGPYSNAGGGSSVGGYCSAAGGAAPTLTLKGSETYPGSYCVSNVYTPGGAGSGGVTAKGGDGGLGSLRAWTTIYGGSGHLGYGKGGDVISGGFGNVYIHTVQSGQNGFCRIKFVG